MVKLIAFALFLTVCFQSDADLVRRQYSAMGEAIAKIAPTWRKSVGLGGSYEWALADEQYRPWWEEIRVYEKARAEFYDSFARLDWDELSPIDDAAILDLGLRSHASSAFDRGEFEEAVRAYEYFSENATETHFLDSIRGYALPLAWAEAFGPAEALTKIDAMFPRLQKHDARQHLRGYRGDLHTSLGEVAQAEELYRAILEEQSKLGTPGDGERETREVQKARFRLALLGLPAPALGEEVGWAGEPFALSGKSERTARGVPCGLVTRWSAHHVARLGEGPPRVARPGLRPLSRVHRGQPLLSAEESREDLGARR